MRRRNSVGDLREGDQKTTKPPVQRKKLTDKVIDALTSTDVLDKIMPVSLSSKSSDRKCFVNFRDIIKRYF